MEVSSLLAKVLFMGNEEVAGVRTLYQALQETPMDYVMLDTQAEFLLKKAHCAATPELKEERLKMALECADRSTVAAPSEFGTWARLASVYVAMEDWENALTILNSCPMFTYQDKDAPYMPEPREVHLPTLPETRLDEIDSEPEARFADQVDASLTNLRAATYKGTFKQAYSILTEMTAKIGWDQLLKIRSTVFVMEDEYRTEKQESHRNPSTDGLRGTPDRALNGDEESDGEGRTEKPSDTESTAETVAVKAEDQKTVEKPSHTIDPGEVKADTENVSATGHTIYTLAHSFRVNKMTSISPSSTRSVSANDGWTVCSWFCTRTFVFTPSGERRWHSTGLSRCSTENRPRNGRFSAHSRSVCSTQTRP